MKKTFFLLLLSGLVYAQNQNVGINTTQPTETLDINGNIRVRNVNNQTTTSVTDKILVADANGVLKVKPSVPNGQYGIAYQGEPFNTGVDASLFAPVMTTFVPRNSAAGYNFTIDDNNQWVLNIVNLSQFSTGTIGAHYEILWINR